MRAVAVVIALAGCGIRHPQQTMHRAELTLGGALLGVLLTSAAMGALPDHKDVIIPFTIGFGAVGLVSLGVYLAADGADEPTNQRAQPPNTVAAQRADEDAWTLTKRAAAAARANDCKTVGKISPKVHDLDADFHAKVFSRDAAIAR